MELSVRIDGHSFTVADGLTVLAALQRAGQEACRRSVSGELRGGMCAIGVCYECRVTIDGRPHQRACMTRCREGMEIGTGA